jgi:hypothetical protein
MCLIRFPGMLARARRIMARWATHAAVRRFSERLQGHSFRFPNAQKSGIIVRRRNHLSAKLLQCHRSPLFHFFTYPPLQGLPHFVDPVKYEKAGARR